MLASADCTMSFDDAPHHNTCQRRRHFHSSHTFGLHAFDIDIDQVRRAGAYPAGVEPFLVVLLLLDGAAGHPSPDGTAPCINASQVNSLDSC